MDDSNIKQVIVIRKDLHMRAGKMIAQACHASNAIMKKMLMFGCRKDDEWATYTSQMIDIESPFYKWIMGSFTKIVVYCESEQELRNIFNKAAQNDLLRSWIEDKGLTEFHGVHTPTCVAIGPDYAENIDPITGHLKLL